MSNDLFSGLGYLKPTGTIWHTLPGVHLPPDNPEPVEIELAHAGRSNGPFTSALLKLNREINAAADTPAMLDAGDARQAKLFAKHVARSWRGVRDRQGNAVAMTPELFEGLCITLAVELNRADIVNAAYARAYDANNFRDEPVGSAEELGKR